MFRHVKIAFRNLLRDRLYTLLNGLGLTVGMAAALLIFIWANDELTFDNFHPKRDSIYRVLATWPNDESMATLALTPLPFADAAREAVPEVELVCRFLNLPGAFINHGDKRFGVEGLHLVDTDFFSMFHFPFLHGNATSAFNQASNIVLTASLAERIFGTTDVVGQPLRGNGTFELTVSGVLSDVPSNSHIRFEALMPLRENIVPLVGDWVDTWTSFNFDTYVMLRPGVDVATTAKKLSAIFPPKEDFQRDNATFELQALTDVYLHSDFVKYSEAPQGNLSIIRLIGLIGLLILLIACVNYVNMSTARSAHRAKAVGVRKIVGATRWELFRQFLTEAAMLVGLASVLALALTQYSLGFFEEMTGKNFTKGQLFTQTTALIVLGTAVTAVLVAGIQPAIQLSNFRPLDILRGSHFSGIAGKGGLRKILVTSQFACSGALIIGTFIMLAQLDFMKKEKLGYEREHIFTFRINEAKPQQIIDALKRQPGVLAVTASNHSITNIANSNRGFDYEGKDPNSDPFIRFINADESFMDVFDLELVAGRWFSPGNADYDAYLINETAVKKLNLEDPIGKWMEFNGYRAPIIGVVKDFHFRSLHHEIEQLIFAQNPGRFRQIYVKTTGENAGTAIASAERVFNELEPDALFNHQFLDDSYDQLYQSENRIGQLFLSFAVLAIFISCLGIFGLATYSAERRLKEIGIRKILGSNVTGIVSLLSKDFLGMVALAMLVATPVAYFFMHKWLQNFAYRIELSWWMFALAAGITLGIALLTVSFQSVRAALANPVHSLRSE